MENFGSGMLNLIAWKNDVIADFVVKQETGTNKTCFVLPSVGASVVFDILLLYAASRRQAAAALRFVENNKHVFFSKSYQGMLASRNV